jgi:hypothetical protein
MKPNTVITRQLVRTNGDVSSLRPHRNHPLVDYHFRTPQDEPQLRGSGTSQTQAQPDAAPKFSDLSRTVFGIEGTETSVIETLVYVLVAGVAALPIAIALYNICLTAA